MIRSLSAASVPLKVSAKDMKDAWKVFNSMLYNMSQTYKVNGPVDELEKFFTTQLPIKKLPISSFTIFADHGRRISNKHIDNPIVALSLPSGGYRILDGQHRFLTKKDRGDKTILAAVIQLPWQTGPMRKGRRSYYINV